MVMREPQVAIGAETSKSGHAVFGITDVDGCERVFKAKKREGQYPDISKAIPEKGDAVAEVVLNFDLIIPLLQAMRKCAPGKFAREVRIRLYGPNKQVRFDAKNNTTGQQVTGVVMSMRSVEDE